MIFFLFFCESNFTIAEEEGGWIYIIWILILYNQLLQTTFESSLIKSIETAVVQDANKT